MTTTVQASWLEPIAQRVEQRLGLHFPRKRWPDLLRGVQSAVRDTGAEDAEAFVRRVLGSNDGAALQALADALTVGETYFFRERRSFDVLAENILPALLERRRAGVRRLRCWSAGCCTGEEAYSLAILFDRLLPVGEAWDVTILATDVNERFLRIATCGEYGDWSFRDTPAWLKDAYFTCDRQRRCTLATRIRRMVRFEHLNLAELSATSLSASLAAMDLILCRNVLMYFTEERARHVVRCFEQALMDGGYLVVSATELGTRLFHPLVPESFEGAVFYRKVRAAPVDAVAAPASDMFPAEALQPSAPGGSMPAPMSRQACESARRTPAAAPLPAPAPRGQPSPVQHARQLADAGRLEQAREAVEQALVHSKLNAGLHHLHAVILEELEQPEEARAAFQRALYLEPEFVLAHHGLAQLAWRHGARAEAQRHLRNVLALLAVCDDDAVLPHSDGLAAGHLKALVEAALAAEAGR